MYLSHVVAQKGASPHELYMKAISNELRALHLGMLRPFFCASNQSKTPPTTDPYHSLHDQSQQSSSHHQPITFSALPITTKHSQNATNHIKAARKSNQSHKSAPTQSDQSLQNTLPPSDQSQQSTP